MKKFFFDRAKAGLDEDGEADVAQLRHKWNGIFLQERFAAGEFNEREF